MLLLEKNRKTGKPRKKREKTEKKQKKIGILLKFLVMESEVFKALASLQISKAIGLIISRIESCKSLFLN